MKINGTDFKDNPEFASALIRFAFGILSSVYLGFAMYTGYYEAVWGFYFWLMGSFFLYSVIVFITILYKPRDALRPYITIPLDIAGISIAMLFTEDGPFSPFFLFYAWYLVSYSLRYGRGPLIAAAVVCLLAFTIVLTLTDDWYSHVYDVIVYIAFLIVMPLYLDAMLRRLNKARDEANQANKAKSEFLAAMSHEIRTPMSGIVGVTSLLEQTSLDDNQKEYVSALQESSTALNALIDDVLDLSKIEAGKYSLVEDTFNLPKTLFGVAQMFTAGANAKGLELFLNYSPELSDYVVGDGKRLRQIVLNLVSNAVKFTEQGEVQINVYKARRQLNNGTITVRIEVRDTGPGLTLEEREKIFEPFYQVTNKQRHSHSEHAGTGLGTTISSNLVRLMNGRIGVISEKDKGACFWFEIPWRFEQIRSPLQAPEQKRPLILYESHATSQSILSGYCEGMNWPYAVAAEQAELIRLIKKHSVDNENPLVLLSELTCDEKCIDLAKSLREMFPDTGLGLLLHLSRLHNISEEHKSIFEQFLPMPVTPHRLRKMLLSSMGQQDEDLFAKKAMGTTTISRFLNILVAEDSPINAKVITTFLSQDGHRVTHVESGKEALEALQKGSFDLVFMDMRMPEMGGIEATAKWRAEETENMHVPIIALTANATPEDRTNCLSAGMDDFLSKPVSQDKLREIIGAIA